jgi:hypothetical protein
VPAWALAFVGPDASQAAPAERAVELLDGSEPVSMAAALPPALVLAALESDAWTAGLAPVSTVAVEFLIRVSASAYPELVEAMECRAFLASKGMALVAYARDCPGVPELVSASASVSGLASVLADSAVQVSPAGLRAAQVDCRQVDFRDHKGDDSIPDGFPDAAVGNH